MSVKVAIAELLERIDIVEVISSFVSVKKIGKDWYALCPFHPDTKPSLRIREDKGVFWCFGCNQGGNAITFVARIKNISFREAAEWLAERYCPDLQGQIDVEYSNRKKDVISANAHIFQLLRKFFNGKEGRRARDYLRERGIKEEMWEKFGLGWAPADPSLIPGELEKLGFSPEVLKSTGHIRYVEGFGRFIFVNKLIFPITNTKGEIIGFGARAVDDAGEGPKYINSPESPAFRKRETFYGIQQAIDKIRLYGKVILVEGYFDVISMHQAGFDETISTLGTGITSLHIAFLKRVAKDVVLFYDGDSAGHKATLRAIETLVRNGVVPKVKSIPEGEDPDSFVRKGGDPSSLPEEDAILWWAKKIASIPDIAQRRTEAEKLVHIISMLAVSSSTSADIYAREVAKILDVSEREVKKDIRKLSAPRTQRKVETPASQSELELLRFAVSIPESIKYITPYLETISDERIKGAIRKVTEAQGNIGYALSLADEEEKRLIISALLEEKSFPEIGWDTMLQKTIQKVQLEWITRKLEELGKKALEDPDARKEYIRLMKMRWLIETGMLEGNFPQTGDIFGKKKN